MAVTFQFQNRRLFTVASGFNVIFPDRGRISLDGGLNTKVDRQWLLDNESPDCLNVIFGNASVETRGGTELLNTASVGSFSCDGFYVRHDNSGAETMVAWWDGTLFDLQGTSFITISSAQSVFTAGARVHSAEYENYRFFSNGEDTPYKYNGDEFTRMSVPAPTETMTVSNAATGNVLNGDYQYKVTYVNSNLVESDVSPATATFTFASQNGYLASIPVAPASFGINSRRLYRTDAGGETFKRIATINDNTTTTYEDGVASSAAGTEAPTDQGVIASTAKALLYHQGRIFYIDTGDWLVKYSEVGNPYVFKATSFIRVGDTTGDLPCTLGIHDNSIIIGCKRHIWCIYMPDTDPSNWVQLRLKTSFGSKSPFSVFNYNNKLMLGVMENDKFVGFAAITGQTIEPTATLMTISATGSDLKSNVIEPDMFNIVENRVETISSIVFKNKAYISVTYTSGSTNNRIYVFDFGDENLGKKQKFSWVPWTGMNAAQFVVYGGSLYYADDAATGRVFSMNSSTYSDNGVAINSYYWTKEFGGKPGHENYTKDFRWLHVLFELVGDYYMDFTRRIDSKGGVGDTRQIDCDPGGSLWGTMIWGQDDWSPGGEQAELKIPLGGLSPAKRLQLKFSNQNTINQRFKVIGLNLDYNIRGRR